MRSVDNEVLKYTKKMIKDRSMKFSTKSKNMDVNYEDGYYITSELKSKMKEKYPEIKNVNTLFGYTPS